MAIRNIRTDGDEILRKKCKPVEKMTDRLNTLIDDMFDTMYEANGVGLAAPQIGVMKRMFAIVCYDEEEKLHILPLVNPKILEHSEEKVYLNGGEGCISVKRPTSGLTPRWSWIKFDLKRVTSV